MSILVERSDTGDYKVIRVRNNPDATLYLTNKGWTEKELTVPVQWDETMLWSREEAQALFDALQAEGFTSDAPVIEKITLGD